MDLTNTSMNSTDAPLNMTNTFKNSTDSYGVLMFPQGGPPVLILTLCSLILMVVAQIGAFTCELHLNLTPL